MEINYKNISFFDAARTLRNFLAFIILTGLILFAGSDKIYAKNQSINDKNITVNQVDQKSSKIELQELINEGSESFIKGKVIDSETGKPLQGVTILIQKSTVGTVTSKIGEFKLKVPDDISKKKIKLNANYVGYDIKSFKVRMNELSIIHTIKLKKSKEK